MHARDDRSPNPKDRDCDHHLAPGKCAVCTTAARAELIADYNRRTTR
jgi:hypothetical protein